MEMEMQSAGDQKVTEEVAVGLLEVLKVMALEVDMDRPDMAIRLQELVEAV